MRAYLSGMADAAPGSGSGSEEKEFADVAIEAIPQPLTFDAAADFLKKRITLKRDDYYRLSDFMRTRAFTVGRLTQLDAIDRVRSHFARELTGDASSLTGFIDSLQSDQLLRIAGFGEEKPWYLETVYRTNIMSDYNAGRAQEFLESKPAALEFLGIEDSRQTSVCAQRTGIILPASDPFWDTNWPPLHFNCRSTVRAIYAEEAEALDLDIPSLATESRQRMGGLPENGSGFGANPIKDNALWRNTPAQADRINRYLIDEELSGVVGQTVCRDFSEEIPGMVNVKTSRGGVRYPEGMDNLQEFPGNLESAKILAEQKGYFVELYNPEAAAFNKPFDAWINGVEKWEFKNLTSMKIKTLSRELENAASKATHVYIGIENVSQIKPLESAINNRIAELIKNGKKFHTLIVEHDGELITLTWSILKDKKALHKILTNIFR